MNIDTVVEERPTGTISMGIGYSTYENVILTGSVSQENLFGTGLKAYLTAAVSSINQLYDFTVVQPYIFDLDLTAAVNLFNWTRVFDTYEYRSKGGSISLLRPITDNTRVGLKYGYNVTDVFNVTPDASRYVIQQAGTASTSSVTGSINYNTLDDYLKPHQRGDRRG